MSALKLPTGVEIRGRYIRIWFMFRGKRCRE
ncbi:Arm DNA-binding domain-containing protein, partial [Escherichia sp. TWPC-MK]